MNFLIDFIGPTGGTIEGHAKTLTEKGKKKPDWVFSLYFSTVAM